MNAALSSQIGLAALDALLHEALQAPATQLNLPPHVWERILQRVQHTPVRTTTATTADCPTLSMAWSEPAFEVAPCWRVIYHQK